MDKQLVQMVEDLRSLIAEKEEERFERNDNMIAGTNIILNSNGYVPVIWGPMSSDMVYVDVGSCKGDTVRNTYNLCQMTIVAIEPNPISFFHMKKMLKKNNRIHLVNKACWSSKGKMTLYLHPNNDGAHSLKRDEAGITPEGVPLSEHGVEVDVDTLDNILDSLGIDTVDLIKIDTEGSEAETLKGFTKYRKGTKFHIEYHYDNLSSIIHHLLTVGALIKEIRIWDTIKYGELIGVFNSSPSIKPVNIKRSSTDLSPRISRQSDKYDPKVSGLRIRIKGDRKNE